MKITANVQIELPVTLTFDESVLLERVGAQRDDARVVLESPRHLAEIVMGLMGFVLECGFETVNTNGSWALLAPSQAGAHLRVTQIEEVE